MWVGNWICPKGHSHVMPMTDMRPGEGVVQCRECKIEYLVLFQKGTFKTLGVYDGEK